MSQETWAILRESIVTDDWIILVAAICEVIAFSMMLVFSAIIRRNRRLWEERRNTAFAAWMYRVLRFSNTFYLSTLSLFPLLGMLGTVNGLLGLDLAAGDMENIRANFFIALTSTAWGIIFSVIYKFLYAFFGDDIEDQIEIAKRLSVRNPKQVAARQR